MRRSPEEFESSVVRPADFDAFWDAILGRATQVPLNVALKPLPLRSSYLDGKLQEEWIRRQLGSDNPISPEAWH